MKIFFVNSIDLQRAIMEAVKRLKKEADIELVKFWDVPEQKVTDQDIVVIDPYTMSHDRTDAFMKWLTIDSPKYRQLIVFDCIGCTAWDKYNAELPSTTEDLIHTIIKVLG